MDERYRGGLWVGLSLRESLIVGFCATFILMADLFLDIPLHLPGNRALFLAFFLLLGRSCVRPGWGATTIGLVVAVGGLSMGREAPLDAAKTVVAGGIADIVSLLLPAVTRSLALGGLAGCMVGASWLPATLVQDQLAGMNPYLAFRHALLKTSSAALFGAVGGSLVPTVSRRLRTSGLLQSK